MGHVHFGAATEVLSRMIEQRRGLTTCDGCGVERWLIPQTLHFSIHEPISAVWCSDGCQQKIVQRVMAQAHAYRLQVGDMVEAAMSYLRLRQPIPKKLRYALTDVEYTEVGKRCNEEYVAARQTVVSDLLQRVQDVESRSLETAQGREPVQIEQPSLWVA